MTCAAHSKNSLLFVKNASKPCQFIAHGTTTLDSRPPIGTVNKSLTEFTSNTDNSQIGTTGYYRSEAYAGAEWLITGDSELSLSEDHDKAEWMSINGPRDWTKGIPSFSGSITVTKVKGDHRWEIMRAGEWRPRALSIGQSEEAQRYEIWVMEDPDRKDYYVTSCSLLTKYHGVVFDPFEKAFSGMFSYSMPWNAMVKEEFVNWNNGLIGSGTSQVTPQLALAIAQTGSGGTGFTLTEGASAGGDPEWWLIATAGATISEPYTLHFKQWDDFSATVPTTGSAVPFSTRLFLKNAGTTSIELTVAGVDITGREVSETFSIPPTTNNIVMTSIHVYDRFTLRFNSVADSDVLHVAFVDHKLRTPYTSWGWLVPFI